MYEPQKIAYNKYAKSEKGKIARYRAQVKHRERLRLKLFEFLGGCKCFKCGFTDMRALQLDHINGGGESDNKKRGPGIPLITYYLNNLEEAKEKLQVLCANCNWIKRVKNKEYRN